MSGSTISTPNPLQPMGATASLSTGWPLAQNPNAKPMQMNALLQGGSSTASGLQDWLSQKQQSAAAGQPFDPTSMQWQMNQNGWPWNPQQQGTGYPSMQPMGAGATLQPGMPLAQNPNAQPMQYYQPPQGGQQQPGALFAPSQQVGGAFSPMQGIGGIRSDGGVAGAQPGQPFAPPQYAAGGQQQPSQDQWQQLQQQQAAQQQWIQQQMQAQQQAMQPWQQQYANVAAAYGQPVNQQWLQGAGAAPGYPRDGTG